MQNETQARLVGRFIDHLNNGTTDTTAHSLRVPAAH